MLLNWERLSSGTLWNHYAMLGLTLEQRERLCSNLALDTTQVVRLLVRLLA